MSVIVDLVAREILDSRGFPTIECEVLLESGFIGRAAVPAGASTGSLEAKELRDHDPKRYSGRGVSKAVMQINHEVAQAMKGLQAGEQHFLDRVLCDLDGTPDKSRLGANAILAVSLSAAQAFTQEIGLPLYRYFAGACSPVSLPVPMMNLFNGGAHADHALPIQEFMIIPVSMQRFSDALRCGVEIFHALKRELRAAQRLTGVGDEGGFIANFPSNEAALEVLQRAVIAAGYQPEKDILFALDCAASEFYRDGCYCLGEEKYSAADWVDYLTTLSGKFPIISIEDGMAEADWEGWQLLTQRLGQRLQLVGDDVFVTQTEILRKGIAMKVANAVLIKMNQVGTLSETFAAIEMAKRAAYRIVVSHRSGETEDNSIADLAVGSNAGQIKTGSLCRSERIAKYNQLLRIEEDLGDLAYYPGREAFAGLL